MTSRRIFPLFSTPLYVNNLGNFDKPDLRFLDYTHTTPSGESFSFLSSVDKNVLDRPELAHIRGLIETEIEFCARDLYALTKDVGFYITNSWVNIYGRGDQAGPHMHHNSLLSGVLYLQASDAAARSCFTRICRARFHFPWPSILRWSRKISIIAGVGATSRRPTISVFFRRSVAFRTTNNSDEARCHWPSMLLSGAGLGLSTSCT